MFFAEASGDLGDFQLSSTTFSLMRVLKFSTQILSTVGNVRFDKLGGVFFECESLPDLCFIKLR